jgi:tetratricopeptide (TPR) repeat protein
MSLTPRWALGGIVLVLATPLLANDSEERPARHVPIKPVSRQDLDRREAQRLYGLGVLHERKNRLVEALKAFEAARRLDPDSAAIHRALIPLYLALDRLDDALGVCRRALKLDPEDFQTAGLFARHLRGLGQNDEAVVVLMRASRSKRLADRPDLALQVWFDLGQSQEQVADLAAAEKSYRQMAKILDNPAALIEAVHAPRAEVAAQAADIQERIGRVCLKAGAIDRAIAAFVKAQKKDPVRAPRLALNLANVYKDQKKYREALSQVETFLRTAPQGMEGYELKITLQRQLGLTRDIVSDLEAAARRDEHNHALKLLLAREYRKARQPGKAEQVYQDLLKEDLNVEAYRGLFELYRDQGAGGADKVLKMFNAKVRTGLGDGGKQMPNPSDAANARAMLTVIREDKELVQLLLSAAIRKLVLDQNSDDHPDKLAFATRGFLATVAARTKQLDVAEKLFRSCLDQSGLTRDIEADVYSGLLQVLTLRFKHKEIIEVCKHGLKNAQATNRVMFHRSMGLSYMYLGDMKASLAAHEAGVADSGKAEMLGSKRRYIDALSFAGQHDKALAECQALLKEYNRGGDLREVRATLSTVYAAMGKHDLADQQLLLILESDPDDATANNDLGYGWADRNKNLDEAERMIRKAIDLDRRQRTTGPNPSVEDEDNAAYVDSLGWALFRRGKLAEARAELEKAVKLPTGDDDPTVWDHLGDVYYRLKMPAQAVSAWKKALSLYDAHTRRMQADRYKEIQDKIASHKP